MHLRVADRGGRLADIKPTVFFSRTGAPGNVFPTRLTLVYSIKRPAQFLLFLLHLSAKIPGQKLSFISVMLSIYTQVCDDKKIGSCRYSPRAKTAKVIKRAGKRQIASCCRKHRFSGRLKR